ncbi:MAG: winged helix-turn-helix transcriptional regulator [SAR202 cluster bacterium]|nr:winged helix-turn-helix transcriptional regulator [SAR202 cluster bacterium]
MRSANEHQDILGGDVYRELRVLEEVNKDPELSQRRLASELGIALGVANLLLREMAKRGYVRVTQLGWRKWAYVVSPSGVARKVHLAAAYVEQFIGHYKRVRGILRDDLKGQITEESSVAIVGSTEMAELAFLALRDIGVEEIHIFDLHANGQRFLGMKVRSVCEIENGRFSRVLLAARGDNDECRQMLLSQGVAEADFLEVMGWRSRPAARANDSTTGTDAGPR